MISLARSMTWLVSGSVLSRPPALASLSPSFDDDQPQIEPESALLTSSDRPIALATSRKRRAAAIGDDRGGERGALLAVFLVDIGDDLVAPLVLEIDVDVGRLVALRRDEALEQRVHDVGPDIGDAEAIADDGIGGRAAPLAEDLLFERANRTMSWTVRK